MDENRFFRFVWRFNGLVLMLGVIAMIYYSLTSFKQVPYEEVKQAEMQTKSKELIDNALENQAIVVSLNRRYEELLTRQEKQADRFDAILDKWEKAGK